MEEELLYTQQLVDNDVTIRMKTLKKLKKFLQVKSAEKALTYDSLNKIWKGLYYCMYNSDKPLVQEDLAQNISLLIHDIEMNDQKQLFFKVALDTYVREWNGSDRYRMDKYLMMFTRIFRQCLFFLLITGWDITEVKKTSAALESSIICPFDATNAKPLGLKTYLSHIVLEELAKVGKKSIPSNVVLTFLCPFWKVLAVSKQMAYRKEIKENTVFALIRQSDLGIENKADLRVDEVIAEEQNDGGEQSTEMDEDQQEDDENFVMDPRAGGVDVFLPQLKPDYHEVAKVFQGLGSIPEVTSKNRKQLYFHAKQFLNLAEGIYPFRESLDISRYKKKRGSSGQNKIKNKQLSNCLAAEKQPEMKEKRYMKRILHLANAEKTFAQKLQDVGDEILAPLVKLDSNVDGKILAPSVEEESMVKESETDSVGVKPAKKKKRVKKSETASSEMKSEKTKRKRDHSLEVESNNLKMITKKIKKTAENCEQSPPSGNIEQRKEEQREETVRQKSKKQNNFEKKVKKRKRKLVMEAFGNSESVTDESSGNDTAMKLSFEKNAIRKKVKTILKDSDDNKVTTPEESIGSYISKKPNFEKKVNKKKIKPVLTSFTNKESSLKESEASIAQNKVDEDALRSTSPVEKRKRKKKKVQMDSPKENTREIFLSNMSDHCSANKLNQDPRREPLKEVETEISIPSKKIGKLKKRKHLIIKKSPNVNTKGKTLKINLSQNREHEWRDYRSVLKKSPGIPFSAHKKPPFSVLKNSDSPIVIRKPFKFKGKLIASRHFL